MKILRAIAKPEFKALFLKEIVSLFLLSAHHDGAPL